MYKLLIDHIDGTQILTEADNDGGYFDMSRVLWHEKLHGSLPSGITLGGMIAKDVAGTDAWAQPVRQLTFDQTKYDAYLAKQAAAFQALSDAEAARALRLQTIKAIKSATTLAKVKEAVIALIEQLGLDK